MKKKHRRAVCFMLNGTIATIFLPLILLSYVGRISEGLLFDYALKPCSWLKTKLRVYDD